MDGIHRAAVGGDHPADGYAQATSARLADLDGAAVGARAAAKARAGRDPISLDPGAYEVVLEPKAVAAALLYPAYLGFCGKSHADGISFVRLGELQWDEAVDIWDDALTPGPWAGLRRRGHAQGSPGHRAGGRVGGPDPRPPLGRLAGVDPTGHSTVRRRGRHALRPVLRRRPPAPEALVGEVERGLLVTDLWYNRILDPKTQVVTGLTRNGLFLIEDGRVTAPVQNLRYTQSIVAGFGPGKVLGLGDDAQLVGGEGGDVMHVPSVRLAALVVHRQRPGLTPDGRLTRTTVHEPPAGVLSRSSAPAANAAVTARPRRCSRFGPPGSVLRAAPLSTVSGCGVGGRDRPLGRRTRCGGWSR